MSPDEFLAEEAWEAEVTDLLGGLPFVDPPPGLIDDALNHRPLYAGRTLAGLAALAVLSLGAFVGLGDVDFGGVDGDFVVPPVADLVAQHDATAGDVAGSDLLNPALGFTIGSGNDAVQIEPIPDQDASNAASLPEGFERQATFAGSELEQQVFASTDGAASIFIQPGSVDFDQLPAAGRTTIEGVAAWTDPSTDTVVVQAADATVTIVGLDAAEVATVVQSLDQPASFLGSLGGRLSEWTTQLGFANPD